MEGPGESHEGVAGEGEEGVDAERQGAVLVFVGQVGC